MAETGGKRAKLGVGGEGSWAPTQVSAYQTPDEWEKSHQQKRDPGPPGGSAPTDGDMAHKEEGERWIAGYVCEVAGPKTQAVGAVPRMAVRDFGK